VGRRLADVSERKDIEYNFYVLEDKELNAMALPGGFIYVNEGLVKILSDDELAYVIGHEVGHVAGRHIAKKLQAGMAYQLIVTVAIAGSGDGAQAAAAKDLALGTDTVYNLISLGYSRHDEYESDRFGARYAKAAGFNPYASISAMEKIKQSEGPNWKVLGYFRSHPFADDRIAALKKYIPELELKK
jgi:predicted Zn-dependent protease